jgi:ABC-type Fe3+ transport system permease subunit/streptogramin lyase
MNWPLLQNSLLVSGLTTALAVVLGCLVALWLTGLKQPWRNVSLAVAIVALALPPFLVTNCWLYLLGHNGAWRGWLPFNIYTLGGTVWVLALLTWPITLLLVYGSWRRLEVAQLESDPALSGWHLVKDLLTPQARSALAQAAVLTFVLALNNFAVPAILQTKVFPAELWVTFKTTFNYGAALQMSWPLVLAPLALLAWLRKAQIEWPWVEGGSSSRAFRRQLGAGWFAVAGGVSLAVGGLSVGLPLVQLVAERRMWANLGPAASAGGVAAFNSVLYAAGTATVCVAVGVLTWRWCLGLVSWLPFLVPGVLLGIALILTMNRSWLNVFYQSAGIVILAYALRYVAPPWNITAGARRSVDRELTDAATLSGATRWQLFRHVHFPQIAPQLGAAWYVTYLLCLWDVETLELIVPPGGETLALRVFNLLHYGHNPQVNALCLLLLGLALLPLALWWLAMNAAPWRRRLTNWQQLLGALAVGLAGMALAGCGQSQASHARLDSKLFSEVQVIGSRGTGLGQFNKPRSVAVDLHDNLYVVDITGRVQKFSPAGTFLLSWQMPQTDKGKPKGMGLDRDGNVVVIEPHYFRVNHFTPDGQLVAQWGESGTNVGQLSFPRAVVVNAEGALLIPEYGVVERVQRFAARGAKCLGAFGHGGSGAGEFNRAEGVGLDAQGRIYVADSCNHRVQVFSPDGQFLRAYGKAGSGRGELSYPYDVRVDTEGRQYVCEFGNSRIQVFDAHDQPVEILGGPGSAPGRFNNPWSIVLDSQGNLYAADSLNHRVQKFVRAAKLPTNHGATPRAQG